MSDIFTALSNWWQDASCRTDMPTKRAVADLAFRAGAAWQREHDLKVVEAERLEHGPESSHDLLECGDCAYQRAVQDVLDAIKEQV